MLKANIYIKSNCKSCVSINNSSINISKICSYSTEQSKATSKNGVPLFDKIDIEKITNNNNNSNNNNNKKDSNNDKSNQFFLNFKPKAGNNLSTSFNLQQQKVPPPPPPFNFSPILQQSQPNESQQPKKINSPFPFNMFKSKENNNSKDSNIDNNNNNNNNNNSNNSVTNSLFGSIATENSTTTTTTTTITTNKSNPFLEYLRATSKNNPNNINNEKQKEPLGFGKFNFAIQPNQNKFEIPKIPINRSTLPPPNVHEQPVLPPPTIQNQTIQPKPEASTKQQAEQLKPRLDIPQFIEKQEEEVIKPKIKVKKELSAEEIQLKEKKERHRKMIENFEPMFRSYKPQKDKNGEEQKLVVREVHLPPFVTVENLAPLIGQSMKELIKWQIKAMLKPKSRYEPIEEDILQLMAQDYLFEITRDEDRDVVLKSSLKEIKENPDPSWPIRAPVVTVVGHIDHGKTSLLDYLRKSNVVDKEAGRITQHIGAFEVKCSGKTITFMDTPGHAAFATMRERGVAITDIALLIVAGDDGVQEQTIEAIKAIKKSGAQMVVAINKMDKPGIDGNLIRYELAEHGVNCEGIGGEIPCVEISAKTGLGIEKLKETMILLADIMELRSPVKDVQTSGVVIESTFKKNRGTFATLLIQKGILKQGDWFICGESYGKIKEMKNSLGVMVKEAKPGQPVEIFGFKEGSPNPNEEIFIFKTQKEVEELVEIRKEKRIRNDTRVQMDRLAFGNQEPTEEELDRLEMEKDEGLYDGVTKKQIKFYVKGDVTGSAEALLTMLETIPKDPEIYFKVKKVGYGEVTETDIKDAVFMETPIIYFGSRLNQKIIESAKRSNVHIIQSDIIYHVFDEVKNYLEEQLDPVTVYNIIGEAYVSKTIAINNNKEVVAGSIIEKGTLKKGSKIKVARDDEFIHDGRIELIKHFKETVKEVTKGQECGITLREFNDLKENDRILAYSLNQEKRKLGKYERSKVISVQ